MPPVNDHPKNHTHHPNSLRRMPNDSRVRHPTDIPLFKVNPLLSSLMVVGSSMIIDVLQLQLYYMNHRHSIVRKIIYVIGLIYDRARLIARTV